MPGDVEYLNIGDAAEALGVNRRRIRELIQAGDMSSIVNPLDRRQRLIPRSEVERFTQFAQLSKKAVA